MNRHFERTPEPCLGASDTGVILHPSSYIFNATMLAAGAMILIGGLVHPPGPAPPDSHNPHALLDIGVLGVGIFPGNIHPWHPIFACTAFLASGLAVLLSYKVSPSRRGPSLSWARSRCCSPWSGWSCLSGGRSPVWSSAGWSGGWSTRSCCGWSASAAT